MDLYIDRDELGRHLERVQRIIERRSTHPILGCVLLKAEGQSVRLTATDSEVAFVGECAANVKSGGEVAVDATNLFQVIRSLPESTVSLAVKAGNRLEVSSGKSSFKLPGFAATEFPTLPAFDGRGIAKVDQAVLRRLVDQAAFSVASDDVRYGLNGAHVEIREAGGLRILRFIATDGHRLSAAEGPYEGEIAVTPRMLIPRKALAVMRKLLEGDGSVDLSFGQGAVRLQVPSQTFWFRMLDGEFPDYEAVVPTEHKHRIVLDRWALQAALKRVSVLALDRARPVRFQFEAQELQVQLHNTDKGEVTDAIPCELEGDPVKVGFNVRYLQDILGVLATDKVVLQLAHPLAPCLVRGQGDETAFFVVMPMRLD